MKLKDFSWILFAVAFIAAIVLGLMEYYEMLPELAWLPYTLVIIGFLVGLLNITNNEALSFMVAVLVLGATTGLLAIIPAVGGVFEAVLLKITALSLPAAIPVAVKVIYEKAKK